MEKFFFIISPLISITFTQIILDGKKVGYKPDMGPIGNRIAGIIFLMMFIAYIYYFLYNIHNKEICFIKKNYLIIFYILWILSIVTTIITYFLKNSGYYILIFLIPCLIIQFIILRNLNDISNSNKIKGSDITK